MSSIRNIFLPSILEELTSAMTEAKFSNSIKYLKYARSQIPIKKGLVCTLPG
jgi:hypothetical protein